jgi:gag-polypeptide of LTR copia-type
MAQETIGTNTTTIIREATNINNSLKLTFMLLNSKNYQSWAKGARISLKGKDKLGKTNSGPEDRKNDW